MTSFRIILILISLLGSLRAGAMVWSDGTDAVSFSLPERPDSVLDMAAGMFASDMEAVSGRKAILKDSGTATIRVFQLDTASDSELKEAARAGIDVQALRNLTDGFAIREKDGRVFIAGANGMGAAYGLLEMSRKAGVSPWIWWGDAVPQKKDRLEIEDGFHTMQGASVARRAIHVKDAEWSLRPWSHLTFEPSGPNEIGPQSYRKLRELMLRLRGNMVIPFVLGDADTEGVRCPLSYRGEPYGYLWLSTLQPGFIWKRMHDAYDSGRRDLWIAEIHDPKVAGYGLELFMDMAWDADGLGASDVRNHCKAWLSREFGADAAELIFPAIHDFYRLCAQRKPEFMGITPVGSSPFNPEEFGDELQRYIEEFDRASYVVDYATRLVDRSLYDAYYTAVIYPVCAAAAHARSVLNARKAWLLESRRAEADDIFALEDSIRLACAESQRAYQEVRKLTEYYNDVVSDGKWKGLMDMRPGALSVFAAPSLPVMLTDVEIARIPASSPGNPRKPEPGPCVAANAESYARLKGEATRIGMLGQSMNAIALAKGSAMGYDFEVAEKSDGVVRIAVIPDSRADAPESRFSISVDGGRPVVFSANAPSGSSIWKDDALRGQRIVELPVSLKAGRHTLEIKALDEGVVVDQWMWDPDPDRRFYLFPV